MNSYTLKIFLFLKKSKYIDSHSNKSYKIFYRTTTECLACEIFKVFKVFHFYRLINMGQLYYYFFVLSRREKICFLERQSKNIFLFKLFLR